MNRLESSLSSEILGSGDRRRLRTLILVRPVVATLALGMGMAFSAAGVISLSVAGFAGLILLAWLLTGGFLLWFRSGWSLRALLLLQIFLDALLIAAIVSLTGGGESQFALLYLILITYAASFLSLRGGVLTALLSSLLFPGAAYFSRLVGGGSLGGLDLPLRAGLNAISFLLMGILAGYLSERAAKASAALEEASQALHSVRLDTAEILRNMGSGLVTVDARGQVVYFNRAGEDILGIREQAIRGRPVREAFAGPLSDIGRMLLEGLTTGQAYHRQELAFRRSDGTVIPIGFSTTVLWDPRQGRHGVIAIFQDLREIKEMEARVREADRLAAFGELASGVLKEVEQPLAAIRESLAVLGEDLVGRSGPAQRSLEVISHQQEKLTAILKSFFEATPQEGLRREPPGGGRRILGGSQGIRDVLEMITRVAETESTVLILGESGTGKELVARELHARSRRREGPFVSINCGALPETLLESELFGHLRGSFTGAVRDKDGLLKVAEGGTFFLDEVSETSPGVQVKLLRVLQERELVPVGGSKPVKVDVRLISATNQDLEGLVKAGKFRADLFYRLNVIPIRIPPLRERKEDIPVLTHSVLQRICESSKVIPKRLSPETMDCLLGYSWPGNVRELENVLERAVVMESGRTIHPDVLPRTISGAAKVPSGRQRLLVLSDAGHKAREKEEVLAAIKECAGNKSLAAKKLGISYSTMFRKLREYGLVKELQNGSISEAL